MTHIPGSVDLSVLASYELTTGPAVRRIRLFDPGHLEVDEVSLSAHSQLVRGWSRSETGASVDVLVVTPAEQIATPESALTIAGRWTTHSRKRLNGSPVMALPASLPVVATGFDTYDASDMPLETPPRISPRVFLRSSHALTGEIRGTEGGPVAIALYSEDGKLSDTSHADERLILVGGLLSGQPRRVRDALRDLMLEIHAFFGDTYSHPGLVRILAVAEKGASDYRHLPGEYCALDERMIQRTSNGWFPAARLFARDIASMWWAHGVRIVGAYGHALSFGLAMAAGMHWLQTSGHREDLRTEMMAAEHLLSLAEQSSPSRSASDLREAAYGAGVALAIHKANTERIPVHAHLQQFCREHWGCAVSATRTMSSLEKMGVRLPPKGQD